MKIIVVIIIVTFNLIFFKQKDKHSPLSNKILIIACSVLFIVTILLIIVVVLLIKLLKRKTRFKSSKANDLILKINNPVNLKPNNERINEANGKLHIDNTRNHHLNNEYNKPLLGPKKYVISSTNLNANNSGSEISESSNNDENSKSTLLTGFSDLNNSTRLNFMGVNNQICYFWSSFLFLISLLNFVILNFFFKIFWKCFILDRDLK